MFCAHYFLFFPISFVVLNSEIWLGREGKKTAKKYKKRRYERLFRTASSRYCEDRSFASLAVFPAPTMGGGKAQGNRSAASGAMLHSTSKVTASEEQE
jgi:hypothetical protein